MDISFEPFRYFYYESCIFKFNKVSGTAILLALPFQTHSPSLHRSSATLRYYALTNDQSATLLYISMSSNILAID